MPGLVKSRATAALALALAGLSAYSCNRTRTHAVVHDLGAPTMVLTGDRFVPVPTEMVGDGEAIVVAAGNSIEIFVRLPDDPTFYFTLGDGAGVSDLSITATTDGQQMRVEARPAGTSRWQAPLPELDGRVVGLRLANHGAERILLIEPRITGREPAPVAVLHVPPRRDPEPLNVIIYLVDTLRTDSLSLYGYERPTSPHLERMAKRSVVFAEAYAPSSHTVPSVGALFASRVPSDLPRGLAAAAGELPTLAETFRSAGYATAALQTNVLLRPTYGFDRGFDEYTVLRHAGPPGPERLYTAEELHREIESWLRNTPPEPFFLYIQSMDVHYPYGAPAPYGEMYVDPNAELPDEVRELLEAADPATRPKIEYFLEKSSPDRYDGGVTYTDFYQGKLVDLVAELGLAERTAIVITSDHGEPLGQRDAFSHGESLYEEVVRIPLVLGLPQLSGRIDVAQPVSLVDLGPTLLGLAGAPVPATFRGRNLLATPGRSGDAAVAGDLTTVADQQTRAWYLREGRWKLIATRESTELYDLEADPAETTDISSRHRVRTGYMMTELMNRAASLRGQAVTHESLSDHPDPEIQEALRALGYVGD